MNFLLRENQRAGKVDETQKPDKMAIMKPDGLGTDEHLPPQQRRGQTTPSVERDVMRLALLFAVIVTLVLGAYYFSNRAKMPDLSSDNPALDQGF